MPSKIRFVPFLCASFFLAFFFFGPLRLSARADAATVPANGSFEKEGSAPAGWTTQGAVSVDRTDAFAGNASLLLQVDPLKLIPTRALSTPFEVKGDKELEISGAAKSDLYFQDLSFDGTLFVRFLDASGQELATSGFADVHGKTPWQAFLKHVPVPAAAVRAQLGAQIEKTHGRFWIDALVVKKVAVSSGPSGLAYFSSTRLGNMFYPGDYVAFEMELDSDTPIDKRGCDVTCTVTDYWGIPQHGPIKLALKETKPRNSDKPKGYLAYLDLHDVSLKVGKYYELRTEQNLGGVEPYRASTSFAILPEAAAKNYDVGEIPFGTHTWDDRVAEYFFLSARLGIRRAMIFWDWPDTPPYTPDFEGWEYECRLGYPKEAGMRPVGMLYPAIDDEHDEKVRTEEDLRSGMRQTLQKFGGPDGFWGFQMGNEPPSDDKAKIKRNVEVYKTLYDEAKKTEPDIFMIGSAIGPDEEYFKLGFGKYCDAYNVHSYGSLSELRRAMKTYHELFAKYGDAKPIYSTEIGSKSQGLSRHEIAMDLMRKVFCFLADGGSYFTWFAVTYPDPSGTARGTYGDSMNLVDGYLGLYAARVDAVAYYHVINSLLDKKFIQEAEGPDGTSSFLFRNAKGESLQAIWNMGKTVDGFISLAGVHDVHLLHLDGSEQELDAGGLGVSLHLTDEPQILIYSDAAGKLAAAPGAAAISLPSLPEAVIQGEKTSIAVRVAPGQKGDVRFIAPPDWKSSQDSETKEADGGRTVTFGLNVPADSKALQATCDVLLQDGDEKPVAQLEFRLPIASSIEVALRPLAADANHGQGRLQLTVGNPGRDTQSINWNVEIENEYPMTEGHFDFQLPSTVQAHFTSLPEGHVSLKPGEKKQVILNLAQVDRLGIYRIKARASDSNGKSVSQERLFSAFIGVPKARGPITIDGNFDEPDWKNAPVLEINEKRQFFQVAAAGHWRGPDDLSGKLRFLWDDKYLYIGVQVVDDIFVNRGQDDSLWTGDSLQFLVDPARDKSVKKGRYDISLGLGLKGAQAWCHQSADVRMLEGEIKNMGLGIKRLDPKNGNMNYEIAIPWQDIVPFQPGAGHDLGLAMIINENDGEGRAGFMGWFSGVHLKELDHIGDLILEP
jgi:hypothetical protein